MSALGFRFQLESDREQLEALVNGGDGSATISRLADALLEVADRVARLEQRLADSEAREDLR